RRTAQYNMNCVAWHGGLLRDRNSRTAGLHGSSSHDARSSPCIHGTRADATIKSAMVAEGDRVMHASSELTLTSTYNPGSQAVGLLRGHVVAALAQLASGRPSAAKIHAA